MIAIRILRRVSRCTAMWRHTAIGSSATFAPQQFCLSEVSVVATRRQQIHMSRHVISTRTGMSFFTGIESSDGGSILKSANFAGIDPVIRVAFPFVAA